MKVQVTKLSQYKINHLLHDLHQLQCNLLVIWPIFAAYSNKAACLPRLCDIIPDEDSMCCRHSKRRERGKLEARSTIAEREREGLSNYVTGFYDEGTIYHSMMKIHVHVHHQSQTVQINLSFTTVCACVAVPFRSCDWDLAFMSICFWLACFGLLLKNKFQKIPI